MMFLFVMYEGVNFYVCGEGRVNFIMFFLFNGIFSGFVEGEFYVLSWKYV